MKLLAILSSVFVVFWNLENFYDWKDIGGGESDTEFSVTGQRRWTSGRFYKKVSSVGKELLHIADGEGLIPDIFAMAEVENASVPRSISCSRVLHKFGYSTVHYESHDKRGIDCALIYRASSLRLVKSGICPVTDSSGDTLETRDILEAVFTLRNGEGGSSDTLSVLVVHLPSKLGGKAATERRGRAFYVMYEEALRLPGYKVCLGDFNEAPGGGCDSLIRSRGFFVDLSSSPASQGLGSIRFNGEWELIDRVLVSEGVKTSGMRIYDYDSISVEDKAYGGKKPFRTYVGPKYAGGISDHYPVGVVVRL